MNVVILIGRFCKDPELSYTKNKNTAVCKFDLAVDKKFKQEGGSNTDFIKCVAWTKTAEFIEKYFTKGMKVAIRGRIETRSYDDAEGNKRFVTEVIAEDAYFVEKKADRGDAYEPKKAKTETQEPDTLDDDYNFDDSEDGLPF